MNDIVIEANGMTQYFGAKAAVNQVSFKVRSGEIFAMLGRNGAGKTTLIKMMLGFLAPTRGESNILGCDSQRLTPSIRERVGYLAEGHHLYGWMRIGKLAEFTRQTHPRYDSERFRNFIDYFELDLKQKTRSLSNGQRAQVSLALCLACDPDILIMDDPTLGVDAGVRRDFLRGIVDLVTRERRTVIFSTHVLSDVERIADHVCIIDQGVKRVDASMTEFKDSVVRYCLTFNEDVPSHFELARLLSVERIRNQVFLTVMKPDDDTEAALEQLKAKHVERMDLSLEDAFIDYTSPKRSWQAAFNLQSKGGIVK